MTRVQPSLTVVVSGAQDSDLDEVADLADRLCAELVDLDDVERVAPLATGEAPEGSKSAALLAAGGFLVEFLRHPDALRGIVDSVRAWLTRQKGSSVKITLDGDTLEVTGASSAAQEQLVALWIDRHASPG
jgi:hypothetical protein